MSKSKYNALSAGLLAVFIGIVIMLPGIIKYNGMFMIRGDYVHQTVTRLITAKNMLTAGSAPLWNWCNFLGTAYTGAYSMLLSFSAVCLLFPAKLIPYAVTISICIRWFVMGVSSYAFLRRFVNNHNSALLGSILYCFSGYAIASLEFIAFYNTMAVFPLLLLAVEKRFTDKDYKYVLIPASAVNLIASSYLFIGSSLVLLVYALSRYFTAEEWKANRRFSNIAVCLAEYLLGVVVCGFTLVNFVSSMLTTSRATATLSSNDLSSGGIKMLLIPKYFFDELAGIFMPAASNRVTTFFSYNKWFSMQAYLPVFGFGLCFAHLLKRRLKDSINIALLLLLVISFIPLFNNLSSFYSNYYTRWWYGLTLIMIIASVRTFDELDPVSGTEPDINGSIRRGVAFQWAAVILIPALYYIVYLVHDKEFVFLKRVISVFFSHDYRYGFAEDVFRLFSIVFAVVFTAAFTVIVFSKKARKRALPIVCVLIMLYGACFIVLNNSDAPVFDKLLNGAEEGESVRTLGSVIDKYYAESIPVNTEAYSYRIDHAADVINLAAVVNQPSINCFESTIDSDAARFAVFAEMGDPADVTYAPSDNGNALRTLLSVKYYYDVFDDGRAYEIPDGFDYLAEIEGAKVYENRNFIPFGFAYDNYITESELGAIEGAGPEHLLHTLVVADDDAGFIEPYLSHCEDLSPDLDADVSARRRLTSALFEGNSEGFTAEFSCQKSEVVFFSVPYDEGWSAEMDGERIEFIRAGLGFIAIVVPEGEHTVEFRFHRASLIPGVILSGCGLAASAGYVAFSEMNRRKKQKLDSATV